MRDRGDVSAAEKIRFTSAILPKWRGGRRSSTRYFYLRGVSTGDFQEALAAFLGKETPNLSSSRDRAAEGGVAGRLRCLGPVGK